MTSKKQRLLIKLSGASFKSKDAIYDYEHLKDIANQIALLSKSYEIGIVVGGGNIWRGILKESLHLSQQNADYMGMLATAMNSICLSNILTEINCPNVIYSTIAMPEIINTYNLSHIQKDLSSNNVCIFAGGTGNPFFTTDTGAAMHACNIGADLILMGKNGVDGVYDKDPKIHKNAKRFDFLSYDDVLSMNLKVMDLSAITLCKDNNVGILVFNIDRPNALNDAMNKKINTTYIKGD